MSLEDDGLEVSLNDKETSKSNTASITTKSAEYHEETTTVEDVEKPPAPLPEITSEVDVEIVEKEMESQVKAAIEKAETVTMAAHEDAVAACGAAKVKELETIEEVEMEKEEVIVKAEATVAKAKEKLEEVKKVQEIEVVEEKTKKAPFVAMSYSEFPDKCVGFVMGEATPQIAVCEKMEGVCPVHFNTSSCTLLTPMKEDVTKDAQLTTF